MDGGGRLVGRMGVTISFISIVSFGCAAPDIEAEGCKLNNIWNVIMKVYIREEGLLIVPHEHSLILTYLTIFKTSNLKLRIISYCNFLFLGVR